VTLPPRWFSRGTSPEPSRRDAAGGAGGPRVVIVGPCASGKSTLAAGLRELGFDAVPVGQEHSDIPTLWQRSEPDVLVALDVDLDTIRRRRSEAEWPEWLYVTQRRRLGLASDAAALHVDAAALSAGEVLARVAAFLNEAASGDPIALGMEPEAGGAQLGENPSPA